MQPSREAVEWGRRQAAKSPKWSEEKWSRIAAIFQVTFTDQDHTEQMENNPDQARDAA